MPEPGDRLFYVDDYSEEAMPCAPTLVAWARWLSEPDEDWPHEIPADGAEFAVSTTDLLACVTAGFTDGRWVAPDAPPETEQFVQPYFNGWDVETLADTLGQCMGAEDNEGEEGDSGPVFCIRNGPNLRCRYDAAGPALVIIGEVQ